MLFISVYIREQGCQLGWRERVKWLQPDIIMRNQNQPGKANIIQGTYHHTWKSLKAQTCSCCTMTGNLTCLLMLKTTIFPGVLLEENIPKQNLHQAVHLHAFARVDAYFGGNVVGSFPLVRTHHRDCLYNQISPLGTSLLTQTKSKWIFLSHINCIDWVLSHKSSVSSLTSKLKYRLHCFCYQGLSQVKHNLSFFFIWQNVL